MGNEVFEHPCVLHVKDGVGIIQLRALDIRAHSALNGMKMCGKVKNMKYLDHGIFRNAELNGDVLQFPVSVISFVNLVSGVGQILHGSVCVNMECSVGPIHMPESMAIFTILI